MIITNKIISPHNNKWGAGTWKDLTQLLILSWDVAVTWMNISSSRSSAEISQRRRQLQGTQKPKASQHYVHPESIQKTRRKHNTVSTTGAKNNTTALHHTQTCYDGWELSRSSRPPPAGGRVNGGEGITTLTGRYLTWPSNYLNSSVFCVSRLQAGLIAKK